MMSAESTFTAGVEALAIRRFERAVDLSGSERSETPVDGRRYGMRPFRTASRAEITREGYLRTDSVGNVSLSALDPQTLLSEDFHATHCFSVTQGTGMTAGLTGLTFQPLASRAQLTDVEGTLWFDSDAPLRYVEFGYRGGLTRGASKLGGRLTFEKLKGGNWILRDWIVRVPVMTQRGQLLGYRDEGGEAMEVPATMLAVADSIRNSRLPPGRLTGVVIDSLTRRAFVGASVWVDSAGPRTRTDNIGVFTLRGVAPGQHVVNFSHPTLDSLGVKPRRVRVRVGSDSATNVVLGGPSLRTLVGNVCGDSASLLTGTVRDAGSLKPVAAADITLSWIEVKFIANKLQGIDVRDERAVADSLGRYAACIPRNPEITVVARSGAMHTGRLDLRSGDRGLEILDLAIDRSAADSVKGSAILRGQVRYQDETPLANATIVMTDPEVTVTSDKDGRFTIAHVPGGTRVIDTRALGHAATRTVVNLRPADTTSVRVYMRKITTLDAVMVRAAAGDLSTKIVADLEERRRTGRGYRLSQGELFAFKDAPMQTVLRALPFVSVRYTPNGYQIRVMNRDRGGFECEPAVFLDGRVSDFDVVESMPARNVVATEIFTTKNDIPVEYQRNECGAILIWTRDATRG